MKKYSQEIFKTKIFGEKTAAICGPKGNKFLFSNERKIFTGFLPHSKPNLFLSSKPEPAAAPPVPPPDAVAADDVKEVIRTPGFFKPEALSSYLEIIDSISQQHLKTHWEDKDELKSLSFGKDSNLVNRLSDHSRDGKSRLYCEAGSLGSGGAMKQDILSHMILVSDLTRKGMGDAEIADKMIGLLVAGYANVVVTISFFMKFVGESLDIYNKVYQ
ncbi:unnamed protein product [Camellia sinensis]